MRSSPRAYVLAAMAVVAPSIAVAEDAPGWLRDAASAVVPAYPAKVNSVVLFNEELTTALGSGKLSTTTRTAIRILNRQGAGVIFYDQYDSASGKVRDFRAWMIGPSGKVHRYDKDEILDLACAENDVYNECRRRMVSGNRHAEDGSVFGYESTIEYQSFSNQLFFHFQESSPVRLARFAVALPPGWEMQSQSFNGAPGEPQPLGGTYTWQMENLAALEPEPDSPSDLTLSPWVGVTLLPPGGKSRSATWRQAAELLAELNEGQYEPDAAIAAKAASLVEGAKSDMDKIRAIGAFTQQVNYVSIQMNVAKGGGYRPHDAATVFQKLYGDCKDKANLTRAMLKAAGITAYPAAIFAGDRTHVVEGWPSLGAFNHAISAIRVGPDTQAPAVLEHPAMGRLLLFDPTDPYVPPGYLPSHEQGSLALIAAGEVGDLVRVPVGAANAAARERSVEATLEANGSIAGRFVETRTGEERPAAVSVYRAMSKPEYSKTIERWVGQSIPAATTSAIEVQDKGDAFILEAQFASPRFAQRPQSRMLIFSAALLSHGDRRLTAKTRTRPVVVDADALLETVRIQLPTDCRIDELPTALKLVSPFGKYEAEWTSEPGLVVFKRRFEMPAQTVPASQYVELRKFLDTVSGSEASPVVLVQ